MYNAAVTKVGKLTLIVTSVGKSKVLRTDKECAAIYAGSLSDAHEAYKQALKLCYKLRKGKRVMKDRSVIDHNAFIAWNTLRVGLMQVKRLLTLKSTQVHRQRLDERHYAALHQWARLQGIELSKVANPSSQWQEAGRLNGRIYVMHNALSEEAVSKSEKAKMKAGASLPIVPMAMDELRHGLPRKEVRIVVKGRKWVQRTLTVNRL